MSDTHVLIILKFDIQSENTDLVKSFHHLLYAMLVNVDPHRYGALHESVQIAHLRPVVFFEALQRV